MSTNMVADTTQVEALQELRVGAPRLIRDAIDEALDCIESALSLSVDVAQLLTRYIQRVQQQDKFGR